MGIEMLTNYKKKRKNRIWQTDKYPAIRTKNTDIQNHSKNRKDKEYVALLKEASCHLIPNAPQKHLIVYFSQKAENIDITFINLSLPNFEIKIFIEYNRFR